MTKYWFFLCVFCSGAVFADDAAPVNVPELTYVIYFSSGEKQVAEAFWKELDGNPLTAGCQVGFRYKAILGPPAHLILVLTNPTSAEPCANPQDVHSWLGKLEEKGILEDVGALVINHTKPLDLPRTDFRDAINEAKDLQGYNERRKISLNLSLSVARDAEEKARINKDMKATLEDLGTVSQALSLLQHFQAFQALK
ncbi:hypothetical protein K2X33_13280 [bacterium]|nr:hypothetical protein [bacterium]